MSGIVQENTVRSSGTIAVAAAGLNWDSAVITASTLTAEGGKGYFINTTSNICTITLPSAAEVGDQIVFVDYARTWGTYKIVIDSNGLNYQGDNDTFTVEYNTSGETLDIVYSGASKGWIPQNDDVVVDAAIPPPTQKAIAGFGDTKPTKVGTTNLISSSGVIASDTSAVGTARNVASALTYGGNLAMFIYGSSNSGQGVIRNLVNDAGVVQSDSTAGGTAGGNGSAASIGFTKGINFSGEKSGVAQSAITNLISDTGVVGSNVAAVSGVFGRQGTTATNYGGDKALIFGGLNSGATNKKNLVSNTGVVEADIATAATACTLKMGAKYGSTGQALFAYGTSGGNVNTKDLVSNTGIVASTATGGGTARSSLAGSNYGGDKAIILFGNLQNDTPTGITNLISNTGAIASDTSAVASARRACVGAGFSYST